MIVRIIWSDLSAFANMTVEIKDVFLVSYLISCFSKLKHLIKG